MLTFIRRLSLVTFFVLAGFAAGLVLTGRMRSAEEATAQPESAEQGSAAAAAAQPPARSGTSAVAGLPDLTQAAQIAIPSVPNISSRQVVRTPNSPFMNDPFFREFFGGNSPFGYRERLQQSLGSGVVVSADGYVLTNNHVIGDARAEVSVTLPDKRELPARIIGFDEATDLAVLKIEARNLPVLAWGDSSRLKVAEWVLAIGNPFGVLNQTVTLGIVSATGRNLQGSLDTYVDFVQTDAAINQGNSGGALINGRGELVGINTAIFSQSGGSQGVGFAVPSNLAKHVMEELITYGAVRRGTMTGIELYPMNSRLAEEVSAPSAKGVFVYNISQDSDAYAGGVRRYDVIVSFNGTAVEDATHFMRMLSDAQIGSTVTLGLFRSGRTLSAKVPIVQSGGRTRRR
jgi:Do/DeqQ family serine protease